MAGTPAAEVAIDLALVTRLLEEQHPDLAGLPMTVAASGWDNVLVRLGDALAVRMPRRAVAATLIEHEQRVLPRLAPLLPVAVPTPVRVGRASATFPWPWSVVTWVDGRSAAAIAPGLRDAWAAELADVMVALHRPADADAPRNPVRGIGLAARADAFFERLRSNDILHAGALRAVFERGVDAMPFVGPPVWVHGDPHPHNLIVREGALVAVVDFGDVTSGDPACDLATAWMTFTPVGRAVFTARYAAATGVDAATWARARAWAAYLACVLLAHTDDAPLLAAIGRHTAAQLVGSAAGRS